MSGHVHAVPAKKQPSAATGILQRKCDRCKKKRPLQRKATQEGPSEVPPIVHEALRIAGTAAGCGDEDAHGAQAWA